MIDLHRQVLLLREELEKARTVAAKAKESWDKFRKERDYHRMHHRRVGAPELRRFTAFWRASAL